MLQCVTQPTGLASLNRDTGTVLYGRGQLGSIWVKTRRLPAISDLAVQYMIYLWVLHFRISANMKFNECVLQNFAVDNFAASSNLLKQSFAK